ncbi:MAG: hypothetical protein ABT940_08900, partial [Alphaproteobacteria bacterium]
MYGMPWNLTEMHGWGLLGVHTTLYLIEQGRPPLLMDKPLLFTMRPHVREKIEPLVLIAAGPPRLANIGGQATIAALTSADATANWALPIGVVQNINLSHNRAFARFWELGSERSYFVSGRTMGQLGLSRVMYHGPSLLRALYSYYQDLFPPTVVPFVFANIGAATIPNPHNVKITPG